MKWLVRWENEDDPETFSVELASTAEEAAVEYIRPLARDGVIRDGEQHTVKVRPAGDNTAPWQRIRVTSTWQHTATREGQQ